MSIPRDYRVQSGDANIDWEFLISEVNRKNLIVIRAARDEVTQAELKASAQRTDAHWRIRTAELIAETADEFGLSNKRKRQRSTMHPTNGL